jgi:hypothetical protein
MGKKKFLVSFSFLSLRIEQLLYLFLSYLGFRFSIKGVLLWCLMGVCVDKEIVQIFVCLVDIYDFFLHMIHVKKM